MRRQAQRFAVWVAVLYILAAKGSDAVSLSEVPQIRLKTSYENHGETWALARQPVFLDVEIDNDVLETVGKNHSLRLLYLHATKIVVLQHPNEFRKKHTSTVPLLKPVLGEENVRIKVGYEFTMKDIVPPLHDGGAPEERPIMLFPGPGAIDLDEYLVR